MKKLLITFGIYYRRISSAIFTLMIFGFFVLGGEFSFHLQLRESVLLLIKLHNPELWDFFRIMYCLLIDIIIVGIGVLIWRILDFLLFKKDSI